MLIQITDSLLQRAGRAKKKWPCGANFRHGKNKAEVAYREWEDNYNILSPDGTWLASFTHNHKGEFEAITTQEGVKLSFLTGLAQKIRDNKSKKRPARKTQNETKSATLRAKINVGHGNQLFAFGNWNGNKSWETGVPMVCKQPDIWEAKIKTTNPIQFKVKLNNETWEKGENHAGTPGQIIEFTPIF